MQYQFHTVALIGKYGDPGVCDTLTRLAYYLRDHRFRVLLDQASAHAVGTKPGVEVVSREELAAQADLAIVVGGDGTFLSAGRALAEADVPIVGVNQGRLGFLVDVWPEEIPDDLDDILSGRFKEVERCLLEAEIVRDGEVVSRSDALNDVVIHKYSVAHIIELDTYQLDTFICTYRADGLILSTPTGSTAYNLSCGGPVLHPSLEVVVMVPICPHTLTQRPVVLDANRPMEIRVRESHAPHTQVICDGQVVLSLEPGDSVRLRRKPKKLRLLHPEDHDYFEILRAKLGWGSHP